VGLGGFPGRDAPRRTLFTLTCPASADAPALEKCCRAFGDGCLKTYRRVNAPGGPRMHRRFTAARAQPQPSHDRRWRRPVTVLDVGVASGLASGCWSTPAQARTAAADGHPAGHSAGPGQLAAGVAAADVGPATDTSWGPLTAADRDLLIRVKLAGLWE